MAVSDAEILAQQPGARGNIYRVVLERCRARRRLILDKFPKLNRFLTGYDLRHVLSDDLQQIDLTRMLMRRGRDAGIYREATLDITPDPESAAAGEYQI